MHHLILTRLTRPLLLAFLMRSAALAAPSPRPATAASPPRLGPWIVGSDWDDTVVAGGNHAATFGIRGVGRRVRGTYPGMTTLLAECDPCCRASATTACRPETFQIWSANPFSSKTRASCTPELHRTPVTRRGGLLSGLGWVASNAIPGVLPKTRRWGRERAARDLGTGKLRAFRRAARAAARESDETEVVFFGDSAQGDADAGRRMVQDAAHGRRAWVFIHDLTRESEPGAAPLHSDERVAIRRPFDRADAWRSPRFNYYKTVPEAAFLLAQHGFLGRAAVRRVAIATRREIEGDGARHFSQDEETLARLRGAGREPRPLKALIEHDLRKCDALVGADAFWECTGPGVRGDGVEQLDEARAKATDEVALSDVSSSLRRSPAAQARVARLAAFQGRPDDSSLTR